MESAKISEEFSQIVLWIKENRNHNKLLAIIIYCTFIGVCKIIKLGFAQNYSYNYSIRNLPASVSKIILFANLLGLIKLTLLLIGKN